MRRLQKLTESLKNCWTPSCARRRSVSERASQPEVLETRVLLSTSSLLSPDSRSAGTDAPVTRIVNGDTTSGFPSVGLVGDRSGNFCSGTLIAPQYVLTAAHCVEGVGDTAGRFRIGGTTYSTSQVFMHPGYRPNAIGSDRADDIAIYKLNRPVTNVEPSPIYRSNPVVGELLTLVGFGAAGTGSGHDGSFGTKRVGTTPIDQVTPKLVRWTFDNNSESNTAPGDSGGPAFLEVGGVFYVAGVTSGGNKANAGIGDRSYDTRVDAYADWIDSIVGTDNTQDVTVSIRTDDASAAETEVGQKKNPATFTLTRTGPTDTALTVMVIIRGTATNGTDYTRMPTTVTIPVGASTQTVALNVIDDSLAEDTETATMRIAAGTGYLIDASSQSATVRIADNDDDPAKSNDLFADRQVLSGTSAWVAGSNVGAAKERGEPTIRWTRGGKTVWWTWTARRNGMVTLSTAGSNFDTTLSVYRGTSVRSLTRIAANDDANPNREIYTSRLSFYAMAGREYQIQVDGFDGETGRIQLSLRQRAGRQTSGARSFSAASGLFSASAAPVLAGRYSANRSRFVRSGRSDAAGGSFLPVRSSEGFAAISGTDAAEVFSDCIGELLDSAL